MRYTIRVGGSILGAQWINADRFEVGAAHSVIFDPPMPQSSFIPGGDLRLVVGDRTVAYFPAGNWVSIQEDDSDPDKFTAATKQTAA